MKLLKEFSFLVRYQFRKLQSLPQNISPAFSNALLSNIKIGLGRLLVGILFIMGIFNTAIILTFSLHKGGISALFKDPQANLNLFYVCCFIDIIAVLSFVFMEVRAFRSKKRVFITTFTGDPDPTEFKDFLGFFLIH